MKYFYLFINILLFLFCAESAAATYNALLFYGNIFNGTIVPQEFEERIKSFCEGFQAANGEKWESIIEEDDIKILFQCTTGEENVVDNQWKIKLLSNYVRAFERNRPQKWYLEDQPNNFTCKDSFGREIPMPLGVQRCFVQHHSNVISQNETKNYTIHQESGTFSRQKFDKLSKYSCGDSFTWKPYSSPSTESSTEPSTMILNDQECAVKVSLTTMHFFCCCYSNGSLCGEVGNLTGQGLTCPQLSMNATLTVNEITWEYNETESVEERISAENLILQEECHMKIAINRPTRKPELETSISLVKNDDENCKSMFKKIPKGQNCKHFERQCYTDVDPKIIYCCRFVHSRKSNKDKILSIHSVYADFVFAELKQHLLRFRQCMRPYSGDDVPYCIYFYDKVVDRFVNIQIGENYKISNFMQKKIDDFLRNDSASLIYIDGQLNRRRDKRVTGCIDKDNETENHLKSLPFWFRFTVAMFKCFTPVEDGDDIERCDDFKLQNQTIIEDARGRVENQYLCNIGNDLLNLTSVSTWDMHCLEVVNSSVADINVYSQLMLNESRQILKGISNKYWSGDNQTNRNEIQPIGAFWCTHTEFEDQGYGIRICACASYNTAKLNRATDVPCNDGKFVKNMHLIENSPEFIKEDAPSKCMIPSITLDDLRHECVEMPEKGSLQSCVIGMAKDKHPDIGCIREPNLSHLKNSHRLQSFGDWHVYQICKEIFNPEEEDFRCVLRDNLTMHYTQYEIICCCRTDTCAAAYKHASKFKPRRTFDTFIH